MISQVFDLSIKKPDVEVYFENILQHPASITFNTIRDYFSIGCAFSKSAGWKNPL